MSVLESQGERAIFFPLIYFQIMRPVTVGGRLQTDGFHLTTDVILGKRSLQIRFTDLGHIGRHPAGHDALDRNAMGSVLHG